MSSHLPAPAPLWRKLAAAVYDFLLLLALTMAYGACVTAIAHAFTPVEANYAPMINNPIAKTFVVLGWFALWGGFYAFFWRRHQQTLGMRAWRLRIYWSGSPAAAPWTLLMIRLLVANISWLCCGLGYLWCLVDSSGRSWHDIASNTWFGYKPSKMPD